MATLKQRLHRKNSSGIYDTVHLETGADCITGTLGVANGGTGLTASPSLLVDLASDQTANVLQTSPRPGCGGILPISRGGTGVTSIDALKSALGIGGGSITDPPAAPVSIPNVGGTLSWAGKTWIVVHKVTGIAFLGLNTVEGIVKFSIGNMNDYLGSTLYDKALDYAVQLKLYACDYVLDYMGGKVAFIDADYFTGIYDRMLGSRNYGSFTAAHEFGHLLNLEHNKTNPFNVMRSNGMFYGINQSQLKQIYKNWSTGQLNYGSNTVRLPLVGKRPNVGVMGNFVRL